MKRNMYRWDMDKVRYHLSSMPSPKREIRTMADILHDVVDGLEQPRNENVLLLQKAWPDLAGKQIATHSEPGFIKDNTLHVFVDHPGWMPELERIKRVLLQKLKSRYRELHLRKLVFILSHK